MISLSEICRLGRLVLGFLVATTCVAVTTGSVWASPVTVVEYRNKIVDAYFMTGRANEITLLDALPDAFERTGVAFPAESANNAAAGKQAVCRFFYDDGVTKTHFYGVGNDCTTVRNASLTNLAFHDEGYDFAVPVAVGGACQAAAPVAIKRLFRSASSARMPNHRYALDPAVVSATVLRGYADEGVTFCVGKVERVDEVLARCPSSSELALIRSRINITLAGDAANSPSVCPGQGLREADRRIVQMLVAMDRMRFSKPLPWTTRASLFEWLVYEANITGIVVGDTTTSYCCSPANTFHITYSPNSLLVLTPRWGDPNISYLGLANTALLLVHEARHNQDKDHTCTLPGRAGIDDATLSELGAWGVQYYLSVWLARYVDATFMAPPMGEPPDAYMARIGGDAPLVLLRICSPNT